MLVLVTGGAGFIGSWVGEKLLERGDQVVCLDNFNEFYDPAIKRANLTHCLGQGGFELCEGDLTDTALLDDLFERHRFFTDDTVLTIATADALMTDGDYTRA